MKKIMNYFSVFLFCLMGMVILSSCKTRSVSMKILEPAQITVPPVIDRIAILNRSLPQREERFISILEGFVSGESLMADREGAFHCVRSSAERLDKSPRFKAIALETDQYRGTGTKQFAEPLDWHTVNELCTQYSVDAIMALETFDSDFDLRKSSSKYKEKVDGKEVEKTEYKAELTVRVNTGWRLYDNRNQQVIDQIVYTDNKEWTGTGSTEQNALNNLPSKRTAIDESAKYAGLRIADRIAPNWKTERRVYFVKGNDSFKKAKECIKYGDWDGAIKIWSKLAKDPDPVVAGRASYNMALGSEWKGDLEMADYWISKSRKEFHVRKAIGYSETLQRRIRNEELLREQMK
jgi:hypothetical protein